MNNESEHKSANPVTLCCWCGIPLGSANTVNKRICNRCYDLLLNAGLTDESIFAKETRRRD